ncbi:hypothetical protein [Chitinibacter sp. GC72]|uniref:hypothetical protein n=1 Tax=Chitinibacter sp. GC72 TaxID=1526917 RepID=UPI0012F85AE5|nr:hypothetical protein [Chitinibacter sp. GC72]
MFKKIILIPILCCVAASALAAKPKKTRATFFQGVINIQPDTTKLTSAQTAGNDPSCIYGAAQALSKATPLQKDEYEKTADFESRLEAYNEKLGKIKICGDLTVGNQFAIAYYAEQSYDADRELLTLSIEQDKARGTGCGITLPNGYSEKNGKTYTGQNSFGVKKKIKTIYATEKILAENETYRPCGTEPVQISMPPEQAKKMQFVRALRIGRLSSPYFTIHNEEGTPTISDPTHIFWATGHAHVEWTDTIYFNMITGDILRPQ